MARKKDKKAKKPSVVKKTTQKQSQKQSVHIYLGKTAAKRKSTATTKASQKASQQPVVNVHPTVYSMPSYSNELVGLENKISEIAKIVNPIKIAEPIKETSSLAEMQKKVVESQFYINPNRVEPTKKLPNVPAEAYANPYYATPKPRRKPEGFMSEGTMNEPVSAEPVIARRRGRLPVAKTPEQIEAERLMRNARKRELYNQRKQREENMNLEGDEENN
jgi:hypothetical protein